jgi:hypothetical protein
MRITGPCGVDPQKFAKAFNKLRPPKFVFERGKGINGACRRIILEVLAH